MLIASASQRNVESLNSGIAYSSLLEEHAAQLMDEIFETLELEDADHTDQKESKDSKAKSKASLHAGVPHANNPRSSSLALQIPLSPDSTNNSTEKGLMVPYVEMEAMLESFYPSKAPSRLVEPSVEASPRSSFGSEIILGAVCAAFVGSLGLWVGTQLNPTSRPVVAQAPAVTAARNPTDVTFAENLHQSLQTDRQSPAPTPLQPAAPTVLPSTQPVSLSVVPAKVPLPSLPTSAALTPQPVKTAKPNTLLLERVSPLPKVAAPAMPTLAAAVLPAPMQSGSFALPRTPELSTPSMAVPPVEQLAKPRITIQGILDLGDKSAMLVARNGSTQNIHLGEVIDSTGWVFRRIERGQAVIQRGSEVRSVSGGEQF